MTTTKTATSKFWLGDDPFLIGKKAWDAAYPRVASWVRLVDRSSVASGSSPRTLLLVNAHFDHKGQLAQANSSSQIRQWISSRRGESTAIFIGDLNAELGSPALNELVASGDSAPAFLDTRSLSNKKDTGPDSTWNGFTKIDIGVRIDHVLMQGQGVKVNDYQTLDPRTESGRFASDHLPVLVEFEWK